MKRHAYLALAALSAHLAVACGVGSEAAGDRPSETSAESPTPTGASEVASESPPEPPSTAPPAAELGEGWLGVALDVDPADAEVGVEPAEARTVWVSQVFPGTPAAASELRAGDVILRFGDHEIVDAADLVRRVRASRPGTIVAFTLRRDAEIRVQPVMLGTRPALDELIFSIFLGEPAPPVVANVLGEDTAVQLGQGEVVVLDFWATWCGPCRRALPGLNALHARFASQGVRLIGVSPEEPAVLHEFLTETPIDYTVAYDLDEETTRNYYVTAYPTVFVIDRNGTIRHIFIGGNDLGELETAIEVLVAEAPRLSQEAAVQ